MTTPRLLFASVLFLTIASVSSANIIWDNGGPDQRGRVLSDFRSGDVSSEGQAADNFTFTTAQIVNQIQWWGDYYSPNNFPPPTLDDFTIRFFSVTGGVPATIPLFEYAVGDVGRIDSGLDVFGTDIYDYRVTIPDTMLGPGNYLLSIVNNTANSPTVPIWLWGTSNAVTGARYHRRFDGNTWDPSAEELAFNISGPVPDMGTSILLFGISLSVVVFFRRYFGVDLTTD